MLNRHTSNPFDEMFRDMERLASALAGQGLLSPAVAGPAVLQAVAPAARPFVPAVNLWHDDQHLYAEVELPGFTADQVDIDVEPDALTIRGERRHESTRALPPAPATQEPAAAARSTAEPPAAEAVDNSPRPVHIERAFGRFERTLHLPIEVDANAATARLEHGVLRITMPKASGTRRRRIPVAAN